MPYTNYLKSALQAAGNFGLQSFVPTRHSCTSSASDMFKSSKGRVSVNAPVADANSISPNEISPTGVIPVCRRIS